MMGLTSAGGSVILARLDLDIAARLCPFEWGDVFVSRGRVEIGHPARMHCSGGHASVFGDVYDRIQLEHSSLSVGYAGVVGRHSGCCSIMLVSGYESGYHVQADSAWGVCMPWAM